MDKNARIKDSAIVGVREDTEAQKILRKRYPDRKIKIVKLSEAIKILTFDNR